MNRGGPPGGSDGDDGHAPGPGVRGETRGRGRRWRRRHAEAGTRALLDALVEGDPDEVLTLQELLSGLGRRAFGMLLFAAVLPAFIPIPVGGAISGPLVVLIGLQLLALRRRPWLPGFLARRGPHRHALARFDRAISRPLAWLERQVRPRMAWVLDNRAAAALTGLLLVVLGLLLALPIPGTNYIFGGLLLMFALALLERDGALMLVAWIGGAVAVTIFGFLSGSLMAAASSWIDWLL
ncbi:MAG TPA: exopolysaccharide biosynthesis protein [Candidatus Limnocylindrales bacterium]